MAFYLVPTACLVLGCILWQVFTAEALAPEPIPADSDWGDGHQHPDKPMAPG